MCAVPGNGGRIFLWQSAKPSTLHGTKRKRRRQYEKDLRTDFSGRHGAVPPDLSVDTDDLGEEMGSGELVQYLKDSAGKMTYTVNEAQIEGDTATVNVNRTYTDITPVVTQAMADYIAKAFEMAMNEGVELDEAEAQKLFTDTLTETVLIAEKNDLQKYCIFLKI